LQQLSRLGVFLLPPQQLSVIVESHLVQLRRQPPDLGVLDLLPQLPYSAGIGRCGETMPGISIAVVDRRCRVDPAPDSLLQPRSVAARDHLASVSLAVAGAPSTAAVVAELVPAAAAVCFFESLVIPQTQGQ
jgi:hypothetical protein